MKRFRHTIVAGETWFDGILLGPKDRPWRDGLDYFLDQESAYPIIRTSRTRMLILSISGLDERSDRRPWSFTNQPVMNPRTGEWEYYAFDGTGKQRAFQSMEAARAFATEQT